MSFKLNIFITNELLLLLFSITDGTKLTGNMFTLYLCWPFTIVSLYTRVSVCRTRCHGVHLTEKQSEAHLEDAWVNFQVGDVILHLSYRKDLQQRLCDTMFNHWGRKWVLVLYSCELSSASISHDKKKLFFLQIAALKSCHCLDQRHPRGTL